MFWPVSQSCTCSSCWPACHLQHHGKTFRVQSQLPCTWPAMLHGGMARWTACISRQCSAKLKGHSVTIFFAFKLPACTPGPTTNTKTQPVSNLASSWSGRAAELWGSRGGMKWRTLPACLCICCNHRQGANAQTGQESRRGCKDGARR